MDKATQATHCQAEDASLRRPSLPIVIIPLLLRQNGGMRRGEAPHTRVQGTQLSPVSDCTRGEAQERERERVNVDVDVGEEDIKQAAEVPTLETL